MQRLGWRAIFDAYDADGSGGPGRGRHCHSVVDCHWLPFFRDLQTSLAAIAVVFGQNDRLAPRLGGLDEDEFAAAVRKECKLSGDTISGATGGPRRH